MALDTQLFHILNSLAGQSRVFDAFIIFLAEYFQYLLIFVFFLLLYFSEQAKTEKLRLFWFTAASALTARFGITEAIRFFYHRPRPFFALQIHKFSADSDWLYSIKNWSFPSGHSAFFFAMATAIYFYNKKWGVGFFIAAIFMNVSRVIAGAHYPSDIIGGAIIGIAVAGAIFYFFEKEKMEKL